MYKLDLFSAMLVRLAVNIDGIFFASLDLIDKIAVSGARIQNSCCFGNIPLQIFTDRPPDPRSARIENIAGTEIIRNRIRSCMC